MTGGDIAPEDVRADWIEWAREEIDRRTGIGWQSLNFIDQIDGNNLDTVFTNSYPLLELLEITVEGDTLIPSEYALNKRTGSIRLKDGVFPEGFGNIVVSGVRGCRQVPPVIQKIATLLVAKTALEAKWGALVDHEGIGDFNQSRSFKKLNDELDRAWESLGKNFPMGFV
jgi:hypothetical protein